MDQKRQKEGIEKVWRREKKEIKKRDAQDNIKKRDANTEIIKRCDAKTTRER